MACYRPLRAFLSSDGSVSFAELKRNGDSLKDIWLPCGMCIGCRAKRAADWAHRCMHEASSHDANSFITLTYSPGNLPPGASLSHRDFQLFLKRARASLKTPLRYFMCGEYGPLNGRPHYHACLFGVDFRSDRVHAGKSASGQIFYSSNTLSNLWQLGNCSVQDLTRETAGYCTRYIMKKLLGQAAKSAEAKRAREWTDADGVVHERPPEYARMSLRPGIGAKWFHSYGSDIYPHDYLVADGQKERPPKYYDKLQQRLDRGSMEEIKSQRELRAKDSVGDTTYARLADREIVHTARITNHLKRELE